MGYQTTTLGDATTALAQRLSDLTFQRWTQAELARYVVEALRTWGAWTASFRDQGVFDSTAQQTFYDLPTVLPTLRGYTVTDRDLLTDLQYALLEPPTPTAWSGTAQFTLDDLTRAIQRRRDQFLLETGAVVTDVTISAIPPTPQGRLTLDESIIALRRLAWRSVDGLITPIRRDDEWGMGHYQPGWVQAAQRPQVYSTAATPPLTVQLAPPPGDTGSLRLLAVLRGATFTPATTATLLGIPDDWAWVVKFGALADLLGRDGLALDRERAAYAETRYQQGVRAARAASVVLAARITNVSVPISSVSDADSYAPLWESVPDVPSRVVTSGQTILGLWPPPGVPADGGDWSLTLDVVCNTPVPTSLAGYLPIGPELLDAILDYSQHLALFKEGSAPLLSAQALLDQLTRLAGVTIDLQQATQPARRPLLAQTVQDAQAQPRTQPAIPVEAA